MSQTSYLVLYCGDGDDIPVLHTGDRKAARDLADRITGPTHPAVAAALRVMRRDVGTFAASAVVTLTDGVPTYNEVRKFKTYDE